MGKPEQEFSKKIPQNSRTLILGVVNDQADNLCTLLKTAKNSIDALDIVNEKLCVKSFEEFKEKFKPTVYENFGAYDDGSLMITYSLDYNEKLRPNKISLCEHEFYKAVHEVALEKSESGVNNRKVDYSKFSETLDPKEIYKKARKRRTEVKKMIEYALEAKENNKPDDMKRYLDMAKQTNEAVKSEYSGSALRLLPLALEDTNVILESMGVKSDGSNALEDGSMNRAALPCKLEWGEDGVLEPKPIEMNTNSEVKGITTRAEQVKQIAAKNWEKVADSLESGHTIDRNVFLSVYSESAVNVLAEKSAEELVEIKENLGNMYVAAQQSFCNAVGYLVQKISDIEQFFIHAGDEKGIVKSGVIIANCNADDIVSDENKSRVMDYLKTAKNHENDRIWFAILPSPGGKDDKWLDNKSETKSELADASVEDILDYLETPSEEKDFKKIDGVERITVSGLKQLTKLFSEYSILSFFNFSACEETSLSNFGESMDIINEYNEELEAFDKEDRKAVVLAYPNFTIIPKEKRDIEIDGKTLYSPAIYVDAAYVAAGIVVATQNEAVQKKKFGDKAEEGLPFIRFDLEEEEKCSKFRTKFNPECRANIDSEIKTYLKSSKGNAFCFRSDSQVNNAFVFTARKLDGKPIYHYLVEKYLIFFVDRNWSESGFNVEKAHAFERMIYNLYKKDGNDEKVNAIFKSDEEFKFSDEEKKFKIKFRGMDEYMTAGIEISD